MTDDNREPPAMTPSAEERLRSAENEALREWDTQNHDKPWPLPADSYLQIGRRKAVSLAYRDGWNARAAFDTQQLDPELHVAEAVRRAASAPPQPADAERLPRWTLEELDELKAELCRRHLLDPLWIRCADAIGSVQFDLVDAQAALDAAQAEVARLTKELAENSRYYEGVCAEREAEITAAQSERNEYKQASMDCHDALGKCAIERDAAQAKVARLKADLDLNIGMHGVTVGQYEKLRAELSAAIAEAAIARAQGHAAGVREGIKQAAFLTIFGRYFNQDYLTNVKHF